MDEIQSKFAERLEAIAELIGHLLADMRGNSPLVKFPDSAAEKVRNRICLHCDKKVPESKNYRRGLDDTHYQAVMRAIKNRKTTEAKAISAGLLAPLGFDDPVAAEVERRLTGPAADAALAAPKPGGIESTMEATSPNRRRKISPIPKEK